MHHNLQLYIGEKRIELGDNANVTLKRIVKDLKDPKSLFSDYTRDFNVPATKSNNKAFKHYHRSDITNGIDNRSFLAAEIRMNHRLYKRGNVEVISVNLKNGKPHSYKLVFYGDLTNIGKNIGDDKLNTLELATYNHAYSLDTVKARLADPTGATYGNDIIYPLTSKNKRILFHSGNEAYASTMENSVNAAYVNSTLSVNYGVTADMLSPAIKVSRLVEAIESKYNFLFSGALKTNTVGNLYMLLHNGSDETQEDDTVELSSTIVTGWTDTTTTPLYSISSNGTYFTLTNTGSNESKKIELSVTTAASDWRMHLVSQSRGVVATASSEGSNLLSFTTTESAEVFYLRSEGTAGDSLTLSLNIYSEGTSYTYGTQQTSYTYDAMNGYYQQTTSTGSTTGYNTSVESLGQASFTNTHNVVTELIINDNLPDMKIMDFLTSLFKMFNIVAVIGDSSIETSFFDYYMYKGETIDITTYTDTSTSEVHKPRIYKGLSFEHAKDKTAISQGYKKVNSKEYGELNYQLSDEEGKRFSGDTYTIDTGFQVIPLEQPNDLSDSSPSQTAYALLTDPAGDTVELQPYIFYAVQNTIAPIAYNDGTAITEVTSYLMPSNIRRDGQVGDFYSGLYFGEEIDELALENFSGTGLFNTFHKSYVRNLFDKNKRLVKYSANIPDAILHKISLNDRLVIADRQHLIQSIETNFTTMESKLELITVDDSDVRGYQLNCLTYTNSSSTKQTATYMDEFGEIQHLSLGVGESQEVCHIGDLIHKTTDFLSDVADDLTQACANGLDYYVFADGQFSAEVSNSGIVSISNTSGLTENVDYFLVSTRSYGYTETPETRLIYIRVQVPAGYCNTGEYIEGFVAVQQNGTPAYGFLSIAANPNFYQSTRHAIITPSVTSAGYLYILESFQGDPIPSGTEFNLLMEEGYELRYTDNGDGTYDLTDFTIDMSVNYLTATVTSVRTNQGDRGDEAIITITGNRPYSEDNVFTYLNVSGQPQEIAGKLVVQYQDFNLVKGLEKVESIQPLEFRGEAGDAFSATIKFNALSGYTLESLTALQGAFLESTSYDPTNGIYDISYQHQNYDAADTTGGGLGSVEWAISGTLPAATAGQTNYVTLKFYSGGARYTNPATAVSLYSGLSNTGYQWFGVDSLAPLTGTTGSDNMNFTIVGNGAWVAQVSTEDTCGTSSNPQITGVYANEGDLQPTTINLSFDAAPWNGYTFGTGFRLDIFAYRADGNYTGQTPLLSQLIRHSLNASDVIPCIDGDPATGGTTQEPVTGTGNTTSSTTSTTSGGGGGGGSTTYYLWGTSSGQYLQYSSSYSSGDDVDASNGSEYTLTSVATTTSLSYYNSLPSITGLATGGGGGFFSYVWVHDGSGTYAKYDNSYTIGDLVTLSNGLDVEITGQTTTTNQTFYNGLPTITGFQNVTTTTTTTQIYSYFTVSDPSYGTWNVQFNGSYTTGDYVTISAIGVGCFEIISSGTSTSAISHTITGSCNPATTTTAPPPYYSTQTYYDSSSTSNVCNFLSTTTVYSSGSNPIGSQSIYSNTSLTTAAPSGYYYKSGYTWYWNGSGWSNNQICSGGGY